MQSTIWEPAHCEALREYLAKGMSYSEIAEAINAKFATAYSRNATIGRAKRMGLAGCDRPTAWPGLPSKAQQTSLRKLRERYARQSGWIVPVFEREETVNLRCVEVDPRHLSLPELEAGDCRYPYGGDEEAETITFCGHPHRAGSSYCAAHFQLTRGPGTASQRRTDTVAAVGGATRHANRNQRRRLCSREHPGRVDAGPDAAVAAPSSHRASARADPAAAALFEPHG
jgi:GcrA cell cycle regulator